MTGAAPRSRLISLARCVDTRDQIACWTASAAQPASAIPVRFTISCRPLPRISSLTPKARPKATFPAAGTVVTEMNTPERPPTLADVSDNTPAAAAMTATMNDHLSGE